MRKSETTSLLNEKTRTMEKMQENFQSSAFYETLFNNLINHEGTQIKHLKRGDFCLYLDVWREPYRVGDENKFETFMEVIIGKVENSEPLTLSETMCLNTFNDSVSYSKGSFTWSRGSMTSPRELILIDEKIFQKLRKALDVEVWTKDISYEKRHITAFVQNLENYFLRRFPAAKDAKEELPIFLKGETDFERAGFYEPLIGILINQDKLDVEDPKRGDGYLYFDVWREPYRVGDENKFETFMEVIVGKVENPSPLTFSEAFSLDAYQDKLTYSTGRLTWSGGSMVSSHELIPVDHELLQRLKISLKTRKWKDEATYDRKHITAFVRNLENYFTGKYLGKNYRVVHKDVLVRGSNGLDSIISLEVEAPEIAAEAVAGQFVVIRLHERGERIPLTIADIKRHKGLIRIIFQVVGKTTEELATVKKGEYILDVLGPLGNPLKIEKYDKPVICVAGGYGVASIYAKAKALKEKGNYIVSIIGARNKEILILEEEMRKVSDELYMTTDDGSCKLAKDGSECFHKTRSDGSKVYGGFVTSVLEALFGRYRLLTKDNERIKDPDKKFLNYGPHQLVGRHPIDNIAEIIAVGPIPMMWAVVNVVAGNGRYKPETNYRKDLVKTIVSLNPIMVDGTGLCGCCRVRIYNLEKKKYETKFACVDGPAMNGLLVDFQSLSRRASQYRQKEERSAKYLEATGW